MRRKNEQTGSIYNQRMSINGPDEYFEVIDPVKEYFANRTIGELDEFSAFVESIDEDEMQDYGSRAFDTALEQVKIVGPQILGTIPGLENEDKRKILDEIFRKTKWKITRVLILNDFLEGRE